MSTMQAPLLLLLFAMAAQFLNPTGAKVADIVTQKFFDGIINDGRNNTDCPGRRFYTRKAFLDAAASFPTFGTTGNPVVRRLEIAAFFANVKQETRSLCDIEDRDRRLPRCDISYVDKYPCAEGKYYYGRGPLQLTWNVNYGAAGDYIGFNGLAEPEKVATDPVISFKTSVWLWMNGSESHNIIVSGKGFGETIRALKDFECGGGNPLAVASKAEYYIDFCKQLRVSPGHRSVTC